MSKSNMLKNFKQEIGAHSWENMKAYDPKGYVPSFDWAGAVPTLQDIQRSIKRSHAVLKACRKSQTIEAGWAEDAAKLDLKVLDVAGVLTEKSDMKLFGFYAYQFERWAWRVLGHETEEVIAAVKEKHYTYMKSAAPKQEAQPQQPQTKAATPLEEQLGLLATMVTQLTEELAATNARLAQLEQKPKRSRKTKAAKEAEASAE